MQKIRATSTIGDENSDEEFEQSSSDLLMNSQNDFDIGLKKDENCDLFPIVWQKPWYKKDIIIDYFFLPDKSIKNFKAKLS